jgi:integrase
MADKRRAKRGNGCVRARPRGQKAIWELRYPAGKTADGKRRVITCTFRGTETAAHQELRRRLTEVDKGQHVDPTRLTIAEYLDHWLTDWAAINLSPKSLERYTELLTLHVKPNIGAAKLQRLQILDLTQLYAKLLKGEDKGDGLSAATVGYVHRVLHNALQQAVLWKLIQTNPAALAEPPRTEAREIEILSPANVTTLLDGLKGRDIYPIVVTAFGTGMRRGEILALRWKDLDLARNDRGQIRVEQSLEQTKAGGLRVKPPKTKHGRRRISLPDYLVGELRAYWRQQQELRLKLGLGKCPDDGLVFGNIDESPRKPNSLTTKWRRLVKAIDVPKVSFHALRHTHASQLIASGMDVLTISRRLGHSSAMVTLNIYGHLFPDSDERAARALDLAFSSGRTENLSAPDK